jgi:predicted Zn-dependent protease
MTALLAHAANRCGRHELAVQLLDRLLDSGHASPVIHLLRGQALAAQGAADEASRALGLFMQERNATPPETSEAAP